ncbi:hypothetical protein A7D16_16275 [Xanthomonas nasturtii]|uniref:Uncharacterized protein n=1 Tax=Xanthomonas nasturtii TaxID=1843581 RepID=A0A3E1KK64_9XANT|nr:hypothetical protein [Xanthomonas nasturtii]MCL1499262.1 hypothetical protein [Xanthomonas nasturtii]MCL1502883.1 hypothetical protein [Xanthomonas nasturtii]MCL1529008.1 hypothetical protein [Xanthomonas nasturtii]MCL1552104.1 hypothetical protein [Xanthomonas nasturtii]MCL1556372.1 hypothetical protein [Xanthomonas nasturtii]
MLGTKNKALPLAAIALVAMAVTCVAYMQGYRFDLSKDSAPAWIQAIGSILAIVAAAWIAKQQNVHARTLEEYKQAKADKQKLEVIMALMARSHRLAIDVCKAYESNEQEDIDQITPPLMADTHHALMALPVFDIPEWQLSLDVLMISRALASLREQFLALQDSTSEEEFRSNLKDLNELASEIKQVSGDAVSIAKKEINERDLVLHGSG